MKSQIIKLLICVIFLIFFNKYGHIVFYNNWLDLAYEVLWVYVQLGLIIYIIQLVTNEIAILKSIRLILISLMVFIMWLNFLHVFKDATCMAAGIPMSFAHGENVIARRPGTSNTTIVLIQHSVYDCPDTFTISAQVPLIQNVAYKCVYLWRGESLPSEDQIREAAKERYKRINLHDQWYLPFVHAPIYTRWQK